MAANVWKLEAWIPKGSMAGAPLSLSPFPHFTPRSPLHLMGWNFWRAREGEVSKRNEDRRATFGSKGLAFILIVRSANFQSFTTVHWASGTSREKPKEESSKKAKKKESLEMEEASKTSQRLVPLLSTLSFLSFPTFLPEPIKQQKKVPWKLGN